MPFRILPSKQKKRNTRPPTEAKNDVSMASKAPEILAAYVPADPIPSPAQEPSVNKFPVGQDHLVFDASTQTWKLVPVTP